MLKLLLPNISDVLRGDHPSRMRRSETKAGTSPPHRFPGMLSFLTSSLTMYFHTPQITMLTLKTASLLDSAEIILSSHYNGIKRL